MDGGPSPLLTIRLMREIERRCPGFLERTDMFAGTSDGALMTLFLATRLTRKTANEPVMQIFDDAVRFADGIVNALDATWGGIARLVFGFAAMDRVEKLERLLTESYGGLYMNDLNRRAMVVCFDAFNWEPRYFRNFSPFCERRTTEDPRGPTAVSAALASSAFPLYLPLHFGPGQRHYIDGGIVANNPTMCALVSAGEHLRTEHHRNGSVRPWLHDLSILSIGASESHTERRATVRPPGESAKDHLRPPPLPGVANATARELRESKARMQIEAWPQKDIDWGWYQWLAKRPLLLINTMLQAPSNAVVRQCSDLLGEEHHRFGPSMGEIGAGLTIMMAPAPKVIAGLEKAAREIIDGPSEDHDRFEDTVRWIEEHWMRDPPRKSE